ncbi:MAG TPA: TIGR04454 family lipoprotein [Leptospiraceae bacterium]|nr:TIGR04454 family lipoprotein [Leptospiraceae bacterium]HNF16941.1 TIGR04454 family lipoprotein [Leptospiraceae bacterium]HNM02313.1 TIGR04454 family lipoprotein [Leptospiraceae bacterium]HNN03979.1 TIGR04454 family lipoprotein [Leptospiraceae bacterium]HNO25006.1 TIGR04454 family lipoprotein [Leptospiraceae bacterium]
MNRVYISFLFAVMSVSINADVSKCKKEVFEGFEMAKKACKDLKGKEKKTCLNSASDTKEKEIQSCKTRVFPSKAECAPVVESIIENFKIVNPDKAEEIENQKSMIVPALQSECESGKYDLICMKNAKDPIAIQSCKK